MKKRPARFGGKGAMNPMAVLNSYQVIVIRHLHERYNWKNKKLRQLFPHIKITQMYNIINKVYWEDV